MSADFADVLALKPRLQAYAYSLTHNWDDAEDLVQSTMLRAWQAREQFTSQHEGSLAAWLKRILHNLRVAPFTHRKSVHAVRLPQRFAHEPYPCAGEHVVELAEIDCVLSALAPERRQCFLMARAGYSYEEIARHCGCAIGTVKSRVNRVEADLWKRLELQA